MFIMRSLSKSVLLLFFLVIIVCGIYPFALWIVGQVVFPFQANGSMLRGADHKLVGSKLIAQPFTQEEYFQPRPSAAAYDATASASSSLAASNYALRDRIARLLGPIVKYRNGQLVAPDIEKWFQADQFQGKPHIVEQWVTLHNSVASAWVSADPTHGAYVDAWAKQNPAVVAQFVKENPNTPQPKATDLAITFLRHFSEENPGKFPAPVNHTIQAVNTGSDIQSIFFDMWRQDHPDADLQAVPSDFVTASASGLDPHITLQNAEFQLDRVVSARAAQLKRNPDELKKEIEQILQDKAEMPWEGLIGEKFVNVLEINLELQKRYG